jgi:hypothetical protein
VTGTRKQLALDTDVASFTLAILGIIACAGFAVIEWWSVVQPRGALHRLGPPGWQESVALVLGVWMICSKRNPSEPRAARLALIGMFVILALQVAASLLHLGSGSMRILSLCSGLLAALFFTGMTLSLIAWVWRKLRGAALHSE